MVLVVGGIVGLDEPTAETPTTRAAAQQPTGRQPQAAPGAVPGDCDPAGAGRVL